jgi:Ca2+-binding RTX toxin-like protein
VFRLYQATLGRAPDAGGLLAWSGALANGRPYLDVVSGFVNSREFQARYGATTDAQFVTLLYGNVLGRAPDPGGFAAWTGALGRGMTREQVVQGFAQSREFTAAMADDIRAWFRARPDDRLEGGPGRNVLVGGIGSDTFVFDRADRGNHAVADLEPWDVIELNGFGYATPAAAMAHMTQTEWGVVFADQGTRILFADTALHQITADMFDL